MNIPAGVDRPNIIVRSRSNSGKNGGDELQRGPTVMCPPKQIVQPAIASVTEKPGEFTEHSGEGDGSATEIDVCVHYTCDICLPKASCVNLWLVLAAESS